MFNKLIKTKDNSALTILRIALGIVLFPHGAQKLLGWFGGYGFEGTMGYLTGTVGLPWIFAFLVIFIEFFGALFLIAGVATRVVGISIAALFTGIIFTAHTSSFFMNWTGQQKGEGFEYHLLIIAMAIALVI